MKTIRFTPRNVTQQSLQSRRAFAVARLLEPTSDSFHHVVVAADFEAVEFGPLKPVLNLSTASFPAIQDQEAGAKKRNRDTVPTSVPDVAQYLLDVEAVGRRSPNMMRWVTHIMKRHPPFREMFEKAFQEYGFTGIQSVFRGSPKAIHAVYAMLPTFLASAIILDHTLNWTVYSVTGAAGLLAFAAWQAFKAIRAPLNYRLVAEQPVGQPQKLSGETA